MTVKSAPYYWVECDGCGTSAAQGDFTAWRDHGDAVTEAQGSDWRIGSDTDHPTKQFEGKRGETITVPGNEGHYCPDCIPPWCLECERPITEDNSRVLDKDGDLDNWECKGCRPFGREAAPLGVPTTKTLPQVLGVPTDETGWLL